MNVDAIKVNKLPDIQRKKLMDEKKCFECFEMRHQAFRCPKKKGKGRERTASKARSAKLEEVKEETPEEPTPTSKDPPEYREDQMITAIRRMTVEKREEFLDNLALQDF